MQESEKKRPYAAEDAAVAIMESAAKKKHLEEKSNSLWQRLIQRVVKTN